MKLTPAQRAMQARRAAGPAISTCASFPGRAARWFGQPCIGVVEDFRLNRRDTCDAPTADKAAAWCMAIVREKGRKLVGIQVRVCPVGADGWFLATQNPDGSLTWRWREPEDL